MAQEKALRDINITSSEIRIRRIDIKDLWQALKEGFDDFNAKPSVVFFLCIFYPLFALFLTLFLIGQITAVKTSIKAVISNPLMMAVWGLIVVALLAVGAILFLIGLTVVLPILGHATWHLYRKIVEL